MKNKSTRHAIYDILNYNKNHTLNAAFQEIFSKNTFSEIDKSTITYKVYLILRYKLRFSAFLSLYAKQLDNISEIGKNILFLALSEIFFTSTPAYAILNEAVENSKKLAQHETKLINALLHKIIDNKDIFAENSALEILKQHFKKKSLLEIYSLYYSVPYFLVDTIKKQYNYEFALEYLKKINIIPYYSYRINIFSEEGKLLNSQLKNNSDLNFITSHGFTSKNPLNEFSELHKKGLISAQGISSQIAIEKIIQICGIDKLENMWDSCCGFGNKTLALLEKNIKVAYSSDPNSYKLSQFRNEILRLNLSTPHIFESTLQMSDLKNIPCILVDAPCSGLGTLNRNPDLRYSITKQVFKEKIQIQKELLDQAYSKLSKNGIICYITCSLNKNENEILISEFKENHSLKILHQELINPSIQGADTLFLSILSS